MFDDLREYSMLSLNTQSPMTPIALNSEYSIVMLYQEQCPTLRAIILRSIYWVCIERHHQTHWYPQVDDFQLQKMWEGVDDKGLMSTKMAEDALRHSDGGADSSGDYVSMDLDSASEEASDYGDQSTVHHLLSAEMQTRLQK
jgi:hypothetical protein